MIVGLRMHLTYGSRSAQVVPSTRPDEDVTRYCRPQRACEYGAECNVAVGYGHVS